MRKLLASWTIDWMIATGFLVVRRLAHERAVDLQFVEDALFK
jgi:hypothetical protein